MPPFGSFDTIFIAIGVCVCAFAVLRFIIYPLWLLVSGDEGTERDEKYARALGSIIAPLWMLVSGNGKHARTLGSIIGGLAAVVFVGWGALLLPVTVIAGVLVVIGVPSQMGLVIAAVVVAAYWLRWLRRKGGR